MGFWILVLILISAAAAVLARGAGTAQPLGSSEADLALYRDQLRELERDAARGLISAEEAGRLRIEVSRRLLAADRARTGESGTTARSASTGPVRAGVLLSGLVLAGSVVYYAMTGNPGMPDMPREARIAAAEQARAARPPQEQMEAALPARSAPPGTDPAYLQLIDQLRATVEKFPEELTGWAYLVQHESALGNPAAAWRAQERWIALKSARGEAVTAADHALQGQLMVEAAGGMVSAAAESQFTKALQLDPRDGNALFHGGLLYLQTGRPDRAFDLWAGLLQTSPADAAWTPVLRELLPTVAALAGQQRYQLPPLTSAATRGPSAEDLEAAAGLSAEDRAAMIEGMVEGLASRLASEGGPAADWARLIRALGVLRQTERAAAIAAEAMNVFAGRSADLALIREAASAAGLSD